MTTSVSEAKPWATPGGMYTPQWFSPLMSKQAVLPSVGPPSRRSWRTTRAVPAGTYQ